MKPSAPISCRTLFPLLGALLLVVSAAPAGPTNPPATKGQGKSTPAPDAAPTVAVEIPKSVFGVPTNPAGGKDPFFPHSLYPYGTKQVSNTGTNRVTVPVIPDFSLDGISGSEEKPLAIVNGVNFGINDELDVVLAGRKFRVKCLEISLPTSTAVIQAGGQRRTLQLKQSQIRPK